MGLPAFFLWSKGRLSPQEGAAQGTPGSRTLEVDALLAQCRQQLPIGGFLPEERLEGTQATDEEPGQPLDGEDALQNGLVIDLEDHRRIVKDTFCGTPPRDRLSRNSSKSSIERPAPTAAAMDSRVRRKCATSPLFVRWA